MRIPGAADFFGQRIPQVYPTDDIESLRVKELSKGKIGTGVFLAAKETEKLGNILTDIGINEITHKDKMKLIEDLEVQKKFERAEKEKEHSELQTKIVNYRSSIAGAASVIFNNKDIPDNQKLTAFEKAAGEIKSKAAADLGDKAHVLDPLHAETISHAKDYLQKEQEKKLEQAEKEKEHSELQAKVINYRNTLDSVQQAILENKDIPDDQKLTEFEKQASLFKERMQHDFGDKAHVMDPLHAEAMFKAKNSLQDQLIKKVNDESRANSFELISYLEQEAAKSPKDRFGAIAMLEGAELYGFNEQEKTKLRQEFKEKTAINEILHRLNNKDYEGTLKDLKNPGYLYDLDPKDREHFVGSIQDAIEQEKKHIESEKKATLREWKQDVRERLADYKDMKLSGLPINPKSEMALFKAVKGTEFEARFAAIKTKSESFAFITEKLSKDPLTFGAARMGIQVEQLDFTDPARLKQQLQDRVVIGGKVQAANNLTYKPILTTDEVKGLSDLLKKQQTGSVQTISQFTKILGKNSMMGIAQQLAAEDTQTGMMIGYVADGKTSIAQTIAEGHKYINDKVIKLPKEDEFQTQFEKLAKDSLAEIPETSKAYYEMFKSYYVSKAARKGLSDGSYDKDIGKEAFSAVVGEVVKQNGKSIVLPEGYDESKYKNFMKSVTGSSIAASGGVAGLTNEDAAEIIRDDAQLYATNNPSVFRVAVDGKYLIRADKKGYFTLAFPSNWTPPIESKAKIESFGKTLSFSKTPIKNWQGEDDEYEKWFRAEKEKLNKNPNSKNKSK